MKYHWIILTAFMAGCAGDAADIEKARYYLGKGDTASAEKALSIVEPFVSSATASSGGVKLEAFRIYVGAKLAAGGLSPSQVISALLYPASSGGSDDLVVALKSAGSTLNSNAKTYMREAEVKIDLLLTGSDPDFEAASAETQKEIHFLRAMVDFFQGMRVLLQDTGFASDDLTALCDDVTATADADGDGDTEDVATFPEAEITLARDRMTSTTQTALSAQNDMVTAVSDLITELDTNVTNITTLCDYLEARPN